jgi:tetratricopeptide (TPR) repeat protein
VGCSALTIYTNYFTVSRNAIYFAVSGFAMCLMLPSWNAPYLIPIASVFIFLSVLGLSFAFKPHSSGFYSSVTLSPLTRKLLRVVGLVLPIPFLMAGMLDIAARSEIVDGNKDFSASKYDSSLQHYTRASMMAPRNADAYIGQSNDYYRLENYNRAIETADKAIAIDPKKSYAWSDKARAQFALDAASIDAISNAEKAVSLNDQNGQAYGVLAQLYLNTADLDKALAAANAHIKVHPTEAQAFEVRADIFDQLGRTAEADADRGSMGTKH